MSKKNIGYNNPAFCSQFDSSLYDYEYVPEIDPDSPDLKRKGSYRPPKQVPPWGEKSIGGKTENGPDEFDDSDESNGSIIVEERNNRRVTMICEKKQPIMKDGGYVHNVSLESFDSKDDAFGPADNLGIEYRRDEPPRQRCSNRYEDNMQYVQSNRQEVNRPLHRYEELDCIQLHNSPLILNNNSQHRRHRYAEIDEFEAEGVHFIPRKPRAPSPISCGPNIAYGRKQHHQGSMDDYFGDFAASSSPIQTPSDLELSDFSPPRRSHSHRQPPVGAPTIYTPEIPQKPKPLHNVAPRPAYMQTPEEVKRSPARACRDPRISATSPRNIRNDPRRDDVVQMKQSARRNITSSFVSENSSPYKTTTHLIQPRNTAVITPILQRKFSELTSEKKNVEDVSRRFQSTTNVHKAFGGHQTQRQDSPQSQSPMSRSAKLTRNKSVPNFYGTSERSSGNTRREPLNQNSNVSRKLEMQQSPVRSPERFSPMSRSRVSLLDDLKASWVTLDDGAVTSPSRCIMFVALIQLLAGLISCGICFHLMSKLGRRYYLDLGILGGFTSIVLGGLGFRANYWKWLPNRNYISGYIVLAVFSLISCASSALIITLKPRQATPIMDMAAGAICGISVIIIILALTGISLSGCCRVPPPDNRVSTA